MIPVVLFVWVYLTMAFSAPVEDASIPDRQPCLDMGCEITRTP